MKIYQVIQCGGEYEDYFEKVHSTFLVLKRAETLKKQLEIEILKDKNRLILCNKCHSEGFDKQLHCYFEDEYDNSYCKNYIFEIDVNYIKICEFEVVE